MVLSILCCMKNTSSKRKRRLCSWEMFAFSCFWHSYLNSPEGAEWQTRLSSTDAKTPSETSLYLSSEIFIDPAATGTLCSVTPRLSLCGFSTFKIQNLRLRNGPRHSEGAFDCPTNRFSLYFRWPMTKKMILMHAFSDGESMESWPEKCIGLFLALSC